MDVRVAIKERRSNGLVTDQDVPKELLHEILEAGTWAPSHHKTEPWKFFVLTGDARKTLGATLSEIAAKNMDDPESEKNILKIKAAAQNPLRAPVLIAVAVEPTEDPKVVELEEYGAVFASIQNMLLAAHELGLATIWRTGKPCYDDLMSERFGLSEKGKMLGFIYLGYPKKELSEGKRIPFEEVTTWLEDETAFDHL